MKYEEKILLGPANTPIEGEPNEAWRVSVADAATRVEAQRIKRPASPNKNDRAGSDKKLKPGPAAVQNKR